MANTTQEKLYETFLAVSGGQASSLDPFIDAGEQMASSVSDIAKVMSSTVRGGTVAARLEPAGQPAPGTTVPNTTSGIAEVAAAVAPKAVTPAVASTAAPATSGGTAESLASSLLNNVFGSVPVLGAIQGAQAGGSGGIGGTLESIASTVLKSGLGMVPLIGGLLGLFGRGDSTPAAPAMVKYAMPGSIAFEGADTGAGISLADRDQTGMSRAYGNTASSTGGPPASTPAPQITVNVQAMDARSFLDRSSDIAAAVRDAMLNMNSLNDVVSDL
ncbi:MAG TPA: hypothetical protein VGH38_35770 [Bryobacteraceae bacterium]